MKPRLLDLFCGAGGAAMGYKRAGFYVVGVDIDHQPRYCGDEFYQLDAMHVLRLGPLLSFDAIHASPPCQAYTNAQKIRANHHPDLIGLTRDLLEGTGLPYVIENVPGAPLLNPITLCGTMFRHERLPYGTYRHRLFETNWELPEPHHPEHRKRVTKMGRKPQRGEFMHIVGHFSGVAEAKETMGIDWMVRDELSEAIQPAYTTYVGDHLMALLHERAA